MGRHAEIGVDWFEVWSREYWSEYLGGPRGAVGYGIQRLVARITPRAFVFNDLHARRLAQQGFRGTPVRLAACSRRSASLQAGRPRPGRHRRLRGPPHPREARRRAAVCDRRGAPRSAGSPLHDLRRRTRSSQGVGRDQPPRHRQRRLGARLRRGRHRRGRARAGALSRAPVLARGLRARRRRSGEARHAEHRRRRARQCGDRTDRGGPQRLHRSLRSAGGNRGGDRERPQGRRRTAGIDSRLVRAPRRRALTRYFAATGARGLRRSPAAAAAGARATTAVADLNAGGRRET